MNWNTLNLLWRRATEFAMFNVSAVISSMKFRDRKRHDISLRSHLRVSYIPLRMIESSSCIAIPTLQVSGLIKVWLINFDSFDLLTYRFCSVFVGFFLDSLTMNLLEGGIKRTHRKIFVNRKYICKYQPCIYDSQKQIFYLCSFPKKPEIFMQIVSSDHLTICIIRY